MIKLPELLIPVGGEKQLYAAVENGADAIYLGGKLHNARRFAENFDDDTLKRSLEYAHIRGVQVYLTMNTLIGDSELQEAVDAVGKAYENGIDALIVQDLGFAQLVRKYYRDLPLHLSTQGTIYNSEGVRFAEQLGFKRVVLARELSIKEIQTITRNTDIQIEVFIHGALCISFSGQCLMSSIIGGRSGNRGKCAQPCRLPYQLVKSDGTCFSDKSYLLSPKELCGIELLGQLIESSVTSLKVEGRMKSPEYVAAVTKIYRKYLDLYAQNKGCSVAPQDYKTLMQIFNRKGFTTGYLEKKQGADLISRERPKHWGVYLGKVISHNQKTKKWIIELEDDLSVGDGIEVVSEGLPGNIITYMENKGEQVFSGHKGEKVSIGSLSGNINKNDSVYKISDKALNKEMQESFSGKIFRKVPVSASFRAEVGQPLSIQIADIEGHTVQAESCYVTEAAVKRAVSEEEVRTQLMKTGGTPFIIENLIVKSGDNIAVPLSEINALRREALSRLEDIRKIPYINRKAAKVEIPHLNTKKISQGYEFSVFLFDWNAEQIRGASKAARIYIPLNVLLDDKHTTDIMTLKNADKKIFAWLPAVTRGLYDDMLRKNAARISKFPLDGILIGNPGQYEIFKDSDIPLYGDVSLNLYNSFSVLQFSELGLKGIALSHELTFEQIKKISKPQFLEIEATVYGRIPLMTSEYCPIGAAGEIDFGCRRCKKGNYYIEDRMGVKFPVIGSEIDCRATILNGDKLFVSDLVKPLADAGVDILRLYIHDESKEEIENLLEIFTENKGMPRREDVRYTKGHYFRGV
ncbi:MAG: U32 family peptidase [Clostridiales bacterium]|nr:U32 family peptidase [Clostridiales bacterium]